MKEKSLGVMPEDFFVFLISKIFIILAEVKILSQNQY